MYEILSLVLPLFGLIILGFATAKIKPLPIEALGWLNTFIIYLALPALFFSLVAKTPVEKLASWEFILTNVAVTFAIFAVGVVLALIESRGRLDEATIQGLAAAYGNIGYMGPALAILSFGKEAAIPVALILCFENTMHFIAAPTLMALAQPVRRSPLTVIAGIVKRIATHPFVVATAIGVLAAIIKIELPASVDRLIAYLTQAAAPCALFAMGVTLALSPLNRLPLSLGFILPLKLVAHPVAMYFALSQVSGLDPVWLYTAVLMAALPTATNVYVIAQQYNTWINRASACIVLSTAASVVTVTMLLYAIKTGQFPPDALHIGSPAGLEQDARPQWNVDRFRFR